MTKYRRILVIASLVVLHGTFARTPVARSDIFRWEYINPANPAQGKQPSATLAPDGAGVSAIPGANLAYRNLTMAYLIGADLSWTYNESEVYVAADLTAVNLSQADLSNANLVTATLTSANFSGAEVRGASFDSGLTLAQLYSTSSYQAHDLMGIRLNGNNLSGANFAGQNLVTAEFAFATLTNADFTGAEVRGANFGFSTSAGGTGITLAQLYSTASYQNHELTGISLFGHDLADANLTRQNLTNAHFASATLTNVNFSHANLTNVNFYDDTLTGANLTGAEVRGASFSGITTGQLYSTASYQNHDLTGVRLHGADLTNVNLAGQNLTAVSFYAKLSGANLTGAEVRGASFTKDASYGTGLTPLQLYSTASYQAHDLSGIGLAGNNLAGLNLATQNLTNANFADAILTGADFTGAVVRRTNLSRTYGGTGITLVQLYSTSSYQAHDLTGIRLDGNDLAGANLASQNLTSADFSSYHTYDYHNTGANLTGANLSGANLTNANFGGYAEENFGVIAVGANLTAANLTGADARGANFDYATLAGANTSNLIQPNGHIAGLNLTGFGGLFVRDYDGNPAASPPDGPLRIIIDQHCVMDASSDLMMKFDADAWDSTIAFAPGIPVTRGGELWLTFSQEVNLAGQIGRTIDLFDWTGVTPTGTFIVYSNDEYTWDLSKLYTTGEVTLTAVQGIGPGDFNYDGRVDATDYVVWRKTDGTPNAYNTWRAHFGQIAGSGSSQLANLPLSSAIPEPTSALLFLSFAAIGVWRHRRGFHRQ